ncbi:MAG TPA: hypothetical protein VH857_10830 [Actinomycetes bacterium]|nr:hypothetical protein [Actinomycetes bacterium]
MSRRSGKHARRDTGSTTGVATGVLALLSAGTLAALGVVTAGDVRDLGGPPAAGRPGRTAAAPSDVVVTPSPTPGGSTGGPGPSKTHQGGGGGPVQPGSFLLGPGGVSLSATGGATPAAAPTPGPAPSPAETPPAPPVVVPVALPSPAGHVQAPRPVHPVHPVHPTHPADTITMFALTPAPEARVSGHGVGNLRASEVSGKPVKASKPGAPLTPVAAGQAVGQRPAPTAGPAAKPGKGPRPPERTSPTSRPCPPRGRSTSRRPYLRPRHRHRP